MKSRVISVSSLRAGLGALALAASPTPADSGSLSSAASAWKWLGPTQIQVGPQFGFMGSRLKASAEYAALVTPTPESGEAFMAPSFGGLATARWSPGITLTLAPHRETYGVSTVEETVAFPDNPFPHTLKASTELSYNVWPILVGMGWFGSRQRFQVQLGAYAAFLQSQEIKWIVDGEPYGNKPNVEVRNQSGWMLAMEYGVRVGPGDLLAGVESQRGSHSLMRGLRGSVKAESARAHLAYAWTVWRR